MDVLVLATGMMPRDIANLVDLYRCAGRAWTASCWKCTPSCGRWNWPSPACSSPARCRGRWTSREATAAAAAAASKAAALISQGYIELDPFIAKVEEKLCSGCGSACKVCPYDAITRDEEKNVAVVNRRCAWAAARAWRPARAARSSSSASRRQVTAELACSSELRHALPEGWIAACVSR